MLSTGDTLAVSVEKPAVGGRMIARHEGRVVLVSGAIPGERVTVCVERTGKGIAYARVLGVESASPDRRDPLTDPLCGGCVYAHIAYPRQVALKAEVMRDALSRIGRIDWPREIAVAPSREDGYRMRARLHLRGGRSGFFREGSHELCAARSTRQLLPECCDVAERVAAGLHSLGLDAIRTLEVSENIPASERAVHLESAARIEARRLAALADTPGVSGLTVGVGGSVKAVGGDPVVRDALVLGAHSIPLSRHVVSFFQGNRYLLTDLVSRVLADIAPDATVFDLYAGVGLFAVSAAVVRQARVVAVEGNRFAAADLERNVGLAGTGIQVVRQSVEAFTRQVAARPGAVVVDPPRTGLSREALEGIVALASGKIVYVSCDVATLARDSRRLIEAGYSLRRLDAFDMFPNTPHVEAVASFER